MNVSIIFDDRVVRFEDMESLSYGGWHTKELSPGSAHWITGTDNKISHLYFVCPCGCGDVFGIPVVLKEGYGWKWDGDERLPTLTPSIQRMVGCRWHGHLAKGVFITV